MVLHTVWRGVAWRGMAWRGVVWRGDVQANAGGEKIDGDLEITQQKGFNHRVIAHPRYHTPHHRPPLCGVHQPTNELLRRRRREGVEEGTRMKDRMKDRREWM